MPQMLTHFAIGCVQVKSPCDGLDSCIQKTPTLRVSLFADDKVSAAAIPAAMSFARGALLP